MKHRVNFFQGQLVQILLFSSQKPFAFSILAPLAMVTVFMLLTLTPTFPPSARGVFDVCVVSFLFLGIQIIGPLFVRSWSKIFDVKTEFLNGDYAFLGSLAGWDDK